MSKGADRKQRRRDAVERTRELFGDMDEHSPPEPDARARLEATRGELEA